MEKGVRHRHPSDRIPGPICRDPSCYPTDPNCLFVCCQRHSIKDREGFTLFRQGKTNKEGEGVAHELYRGGGRHWGGPNNKHEMDVLRHVLTNDWESVSHLGGHGSERYSKYYP